MFVCGLGGFRCMIRVCSGELGEKKTDTNTINYGGHPFVVSEGSWLLLTY